VRPSVGEDCHLPQVFAGVFISCVSGDDGVCRRVLIFFDGVGVSWCKRFETGVLMWRIERVGGHRARKTWSIREENESRSLSASETTAFHDGESLRNCEIRRRVFNVNFYCPQHAQFYYTLVRILVVLQQFFLLYFYIARIFLYLLVHSVMKFDE
jgi:hypothetical protein